MSFTVGEIVAPLGRAEMDNDVQLKWYPRDEKNLRQTRNYMWTSQAPGGYQSSLALLRKVRDGFALDSQPNRFVFLATYGHGKTHLALALANYFGQERGSAEVENILCNIERAAPDDAQSMRRFREIHPKFLVLRLGESVGALPPQILKGLQDALREQPETADADLGLWFGQALKVLDDLEEHQTTKLEQWLRSHGGAIADGATLRDRLVRCDTAMWDIARGAVHAATNVMPDFGGATSPRDAIEEVCRTWCGEGKPYAGLLVIFDEFAAWVRDYARNPFGHSGFPLQSLLEGVENSKGKAVFVALAQQDPDKMLELERRHSSNNADMEGISKELTRLPLPWRFDLFSSLETVLDSYLRQDDAAWDAMMKLDGFYGAVLEASDDVEVMFEERYGEHVKWGAEKIQRIITKGCFPLHPLTTAILCSLKLRAVGSARPIMGFVAKELEAKRLQPALKDGAPNWIYATALVPAFEDMIAHDDADWAQFLQAWRTVGGNNAPREHQEVLRAMLLHDAAELAVSRVAGAFAGNLAALCGLEKKAVQTALREIEGLGAIVHQPGRDVYTFYALGQDGGKAESWLRDGVGRLQSDPVQLRAALENIAQSELWAPLEVKVNNGHPADWAAPVHLVPRELFEPVYLKNLLRPLSLGRDGNFDERPRGFVLCPLASDDDDTRFFKENAERILDEAVRDLGDCVPAAAVELGAWAQPNFRAALLRQYVLLRATREDRETVGEAFEAIKNRVNKDVDTEIEAWQAGDVLVPHAFRAAMENRATRGLPRSISGVLPDLYDQAYRFRPPGFFRNYKLETPKLRAAVKDACSHLAHGTMSQWPIISKPTPLGTHRELVEQFLGSGNREHWGVVSFDGRLREPTNERARKAWQVLEEAVPPGSESVPVRDTFVKLMNAPYGYDFNTASLLFCAWFGANERYLRLETVAGREVSISDCLQETSARKFLEKLCYNLQARLSRITAPGTTEIDRIIRDVKSDGKRDEKTAADMRAKLALYISDDNAEPKLKDSAHSALAQIDADLALAQAYRAWFARSWESVASLKNFAETIEFWKKLQSPPPLGAVEPASGDEDAPDLDLPALRERAREEIRRTIEIWCGAREKLSSLENYGNLKAELGRAVKVLTDNGLNEFLGRVEEARERLEAARAAIANRDADKDFVSVLRSLRGVKQMPLVALRDQREEIDKYQPNVEDTRTLMQEKRAELQLAIEEAEAFAPLLAARCDAVESVAEVKQVRTDIERRLDRFEGSEESAILGRAHKRLEQLERTFERLKDAQRDKIKDASELKRLGATIDKLAAEEHLGAAQSQLCARVRSEIEARFLASIEASRAALENFEARLEQGEDAVALKVEIERDLERGLAFLPEDLKPRLRVLTRAAQKRIDSDQAKKVEDEFRKIQDRAKQRECLRALQALVSPPHATQSDATESQSATSEVTAAI